MADPEKARLLHTEPSLAHGFPAAAPMKSPREFKGKWFHLLGDCSPADVSATCLAIHAPAVAFGWNSQRGLGLVWWKEMLKLMLLTCGVCALLRVSLVVLVETQCHDVMHGPMGMRGPHHPEPWMMPRGNDTKMALPGRMMDDPRPLPHPEGDATLPRPDGDHDDKDGDREEQDEHHDRKHHDHPRPEDDKETRPHHHDDDDDDHKHHWGPHHHHHHWGHGPFDDDFDMDKMSAEDREALRDCAVHVAPWAVLLVSVGISALVYAAYLAALRRRMMRERFGIQGSFKHDLLLWLGCAPCALAQETRTLMFNNVEEGLWHGPLPVVAALAPRQVQPMTA